MNTVSIPTHQEIRDIVKEELSHLTLPGPTPEKNNLIGKKEAMKLLGGISRATLDNLRRRGVIKAYKVGHLVRFKKDELLEAIEKINS